MTAPDHILELIERFKFNEASYRSSIYNETQLRREFLDPFFEELGWDVLNRQGYAEAYKDVIHEDAIKVGGATKAPDYCFRIGGARKFFLEAKKPAVNIKEDISPAFQLRRYAWSAKLPLSILSDFEEFAVYDCRTEPVKTDKASTARILYCRYAEYHDKWDEIAGIFSKQAILKGSFDKYAAGKNRKGTQEVDAAFLKEIESWREALAKNLALRNPDLTTRELNFAVQRTIDRIIFLRICEARGIERYEQLQELLKSQHVYQDLAVLFQRADDRYNSGLFHFRKEKDRSEPPDDLTLKLSLDDKPLKDILRKLYYPDSPYEFSVLPADILGQVYEQFLGKVIRLTAGHQAKVEEKPEVRKAGGVYYTPTYIVDYIVKQTVGKLCEGKTPKDASKLRILDPACGSGSFLLGAYQYLLDWHRDWYSQNEPEKQARGKNPAVFQNATISGQGANGEWRLTTGERKRILLNNIYGVDIDTQAVETTKLSLLLKVLEGETAETVGQSQRLFQERALPDLGDNIKCGNSLIGSDFFDQQQMSFLDEEEKYRINIFDWHTGFPGVMKDGGFDVVIGNPPYIRIQTMKEWAPIEVEFYKQDYKSASKGNYDIYVVFVEQSLKRLNKSGRVGFILPHKFFNAQYGQPLRELIAKGRHLSSVVHFGDKQVFSGATTYTCLLFLDKAGSAQCEFVSVGDIDDWRNGDNALIGGIEASAISGSEWNFTVGKGAAVFERLNQMPVKLGDVAERIAQGIRTSANEVYVLDEVSSKTNLLTAYSKQLDKEITVERKAISLFLQGREIKPYSIQSSGKVVLMPYQVSDRGAELITESELKKTVPKAFEYLRENKAYLESREKGRFRGVSWYVYGRPQNIDLMLLPKILVPDIADRASFALDEAGEYAFTSGYGITLKEEVLESPKYILGLLNSNVLDFFIRQISTPLRGGFFRYFTQFLEKLPIRTINFNDSADRARHDLMVALVEQMLQLHRQLATAKTGHEQTQLQRQIDATDRQIDRLVYELYGLTEDEIRIVESAAT